MDGDQGIALPDIVEEACSRHFELIAVTGVGGTLTFGELWRQAVLLAGDLVARGIQPEDRVGLSAEQSSEHLIGMVGILLAGAAYVPLDPSYPLNRLEYMVSDAEIAKIVAPEHLRASVSTLGEPIALPSRQPQDIDVNVPRPLVKVNGRTAAYVIYTSGSTGRPKGVVIEHRSVVELLQWMVKDLGLRPKDRLIGTYTTGFDASVPTFLLPIASGCTLIALPTPTTRDPRALADAIGRFGPRAVGTSPTMLQMLVDSGWKGDKEVELYSGGERISESVIRYLVPRIRALRNYYGPTEATVLVTGTRLREQDIDSPVGFPRAGVECLLLDSSGEPARLGETGELYIAGTALARGYLNDSNLTEERFATVGALGPPRRAYRTGDLARFREDGALLIQGRVDDQMKVRGYRIEPGEIERRLVEHPKIVDAVVAAVPSAGSGGETRLVAFIKTTETIDVRLLRHFVRDALPVFMVPNSFIELETFPLTPNGKVDRNQLASSATEIPQPLDVLEVPNENSAPRDLEIVLREAFATVLSIGTTSFSLDDDFFELGGTSVQALRLFMLIEQRLKVTLPLSTLVTYSTVRDLASVIGARWSTAYNGPRYEWERVLSNLWAEILGMDHVDRSANFFSLSDDRNVALVMLAQLETIHGVKVTLAELHEVETVAGLAALTEGRASRSTLVPLTTTGTTTPFFCIAGSGGLALSFLSLARQLGPEQPFYGVQAHGLERRGLIDFTLSRAAARCLTDIRRVQATGPYLIGGHSLGGVLALMVAQQLAEEGEEVALLALLDPDISRRMTGLKGKRPKDPENHQGIRPKRLPKTSILLHLALGGLVPLHGADQFELFAFVGVLQSKLARRLHSWGGRTIVFTSDEGEFLASHLLQGPWSQLSVSGDHLSMLQRPYVTVLSQRLRSEIAMALSHTRRALTGNVGDTNNALIPTNGQPVPEDLRSGLASDVSRPSMGKGDSAR
jgi:amino acid adenylation domain-containing protein